MKNKRNLNTKWLLLQNDQNADTTLLHSHDDITCVCTNIISWASTHNTVISGYWFESQCVSHGTACWVSCSIVVPVYLSIEILHTRNTNIYHQQTLSSDFCHFEITRNNKCTVYSFQEKYQLLCSSILSYILTYHIFLKYINCSNHYSNILFLKNHIKIVFSLI